MATDKRGRQPPGRRPHRKSRNGCLQCKQRHAKCDEFRPACVGCTSSGRRCSYLDLLPIVRPGLSPDVHHPSVLLSPLSSAATPASTGSTCLTTTGLGVDAENVAGSSPMPPTVVRPIPTSPLRFEMRHLILMHHLDTVVLKDPFVSPEPDDRGPINISKVIVESAETVPYLVIEALALSSAHLGTTQTDPAERMKHSQAAEELQAQALSLFNQAHLQITEENCIPIFLFSSLTGMHALFNISDAKSSQFIAEFIQYLQVHRGVRLVIGDCWRIICNSGIIQHVDVFNALTLDQPKTSGPVDESDILVGLLSDSRSTLGADIFGVYIRATESLQQIYQNHRSLPPHVRPSMIIAWPLTVSPEYIELVNQRQPIALIILAYWALLLHYEGEFWVFKNSGQLLIKSVSEHVGPCWDKWLVHLKESIGITTTEDGAGSGT